MERIYVTYIRIGQTQFGDKIPAFHMAINYERIINGVVVTTRMNYGDSMNYGDRLPIAEIGCLTLAPHIFRKARTATNYGDMIPIAEIDCLTLAPLISRKAVSKRCYGDRIPIAEIGCLGVTGTGYQLQK